MTAKGSSRQPEVKLELKKDLHELNLKLSSDTNVMSSNFKHQTDLSAYHFADSSIIRADRGIPDSSDLIDDDLKQSVSPIRPHSAGASYRATGSIKKPSAIGALATANHSDAISSIITSGQLQDAPKTMIQVYDPTVLRDDLITALDMEIQHHLLLQSIIMNKARNSLHPIVETSLGVATINSPNENNISEIDPFQIISPSADTKTKRFIGYNADESIGIVRETARHLFRVRFLAVLKQALNRIQPVTQSRQDTLTFSRIKLLPHVSTKPNTSKELKESSHGIIHRRNSLSHTPANVFNEDLTNLVNDHHQTTSHLGIFACTSSEVMDEDNLVHMSPDKPSLEADNHVQVPRPLTAPIPAVNTHTLRKVNSINISNTLKSSRSMAISEKSFDLSIANDSLDDSIDYTVSANVLNPKVNSVNKTSLDPGHTNSTRIENNSIQKQDESPNVTTSRIDSRHNDIERLLKLDENPTLADLNKRLMIRELSLQQEEIDINEEYKSKGMKDDEENNPEYLELTLQVQRLIGNKQLQLYHRPPPSWDAESRGIHGDSNIDKTKTKKRPMSGNTLRKHNKEAIIMSPLISEPQNQGSSLDQFNSKSMDNLIDKTTQALSEVVPEPIIAPFPNVINGLNANSRSSAMSISIDNHDIHTQPIETTVLQPPKTSPEESHIKPISDSELFLSRRLIGINSHIHGSSDKNSRAFKK